MKIIRHPDYKKQCDVAFWRENLIYPKPLSIAICGNITIIDVGFLLYATG